MTCQIFTHLSWNIFRTTWTPWCLQNFLSTVWNAYTHTNLAISTNFRNLKHILDTKLGTNRFEIKHITPYEVHTIIDKLNVGKATGIDGVGPIILKQCGDTITPCIASIINSRIAHGVFPDKLKEAPVIPIFKSGNKENPNNYLPISILWIWISVDGYSK